MELQGNLCVRELASDLGVKSAADTGTQVKIDPDIHNRGRAYFAVLVIDRKW